MAQSRRAMLESVLSFILPQRPAHPKPTVNGEPYGYSANPIISLAMDEAAKLALEKFTPAVVTNLTSTGD